MKNNINSSFTTPDMFTLVGQEPYFYRLSAPVETEPLDCNNVGPCLECSHPVIQMPDRFACAQNAAGDCPFYLDIADIMTVFSNHLTPWALETVVEALENGELVSDLLASREEVVMRWFGKDGFLESCQVALSKADQGQWSVMITHDVDDLFS